MDISGIIPSTINLPSVAASISSTDTPGAVSTNLNPPCGSTSNTVIHYVLDRLLGISYCFIDHCLKVSFI